MTTYERWAGGSDVQSSGSNIPLSAGDPQWQGITMTAGSLEVRMPPCRGAGTILVERGENWFIINKGVNTLTVTDRSGNAIDGGTSVAQNKAAWVWCEDNSTTDGTWRSIIMDATAGSISPITTFGYAWGLGSGNRRTAEHNQVLDSWSLTATNAPYVLDASFGQDVGGHKNNSVGYLIFYPNDELYEWENSTDTWSLKTGASSRNNPPFSLTHEDDTGDFLWAPGINALGGGTSEDEEVWKYDLVASGWSEIAGGLGGTTLANDGWADAPSGDTVIVNLSSNKTLGWDYSSETTVSYNASPRVAQNDFGGFLVPDGNVLIDVMGWVQNSPYMLSDEVWLFDPGTNIYTQKSDVTFDPVEEFYAWAITDKGYVYGGYYDQGSGIDSEDTYEYDEPTDTWAQIASFASGATNTEGRSYHAHGIG